MMHCHTLQHMVMGMQTAWIFGNRDEIMEQSGPAPEGFLTYGSSVVGNRDR
jgi:hypothetical protein